jgi:glycosyltransferase involved in cell wall biosynthesis
VGESVAIGYCTWELETPPRAWAGTARAFDEVWTLSHFSARALAPTSPVPVQVMWPAIPEAAEAVPEVGTGRALLPADEAFTVLFVFDLWSRMERKNPLGLVEAFERAFCGDAGARLVIKAGGARQHPDELRRLREAAAGRRVLLLEEDLSRDEVLALMRACDVYASLHRAEGFGLTIAEAMALGKPVVATHYSGNTDFMTPWNSFPVPYRLVELPADDHVYPRGSVWAEPDLDAAASALRDIRRDPERARVVAERGRADVRAKLSAEACGRRMLTRLRSLARSPGLRPQGTPGRPPA